MLTGPQRKFCEGIVAGLSATAAYCDAYPKSSSENARKHSTRMKGNDEIQGEIKRLRDKADDKAGSAVMTLMEKRIFLARLVRAKVANEPPDSDLWFSIKRTEFGTEYKLSDKLAAIKADNDLAGVGSEAGVNDEITEMLRRLNAPSNDSAVVA
jgi:hypothetical protein